VRTCEDNGRIQRKKTLTTFAVNSDSVHVDYTDERGTTHALDMTAVVKKLETLTTLVDNAADSKGPVFLHPIQQARP